MLILASDCASVLRFCSQLFYSHPPLYPASQVAWLVALFSKLPGDGTDKDKGQSLSSDLVSPVPSRTSSSSAFLGHIGLMDLDSLHRRQSRAGSASICWIASTSDRVYWDKSALWDLFVDLSDGSGPLADPRTSSSATEFMGSRSNSGRAPPPMYFSSRDSKAGIKSSSSESALRRPVTHTYTDRALFAALTAGATISNQPLTDLLPLYLAGTINVDAAVLWNRVCEVCWGICQYATGANLLESYEEDDDARVPEDVQAGSGPSRNRRIHAHVHRHGSSGRFGVVQGASSRDRPGGTIRLDGPEDERINTPSAKDPSHTPSAAVVACAPDPKVEEESAELDWEDLGNEDANLEEALRILQVLQGRAKEVVHRLRELLSGRRPAGSDERSNEREDGVGGARTDDEDGQDQDEAMSTALLASYSRPHQSPPFATNLSSSDIRYLGFNPWSTGPAGDVAFVNQLARRLMVG